MKDDLIWMNEKHIEDGAIYIDIPVDPKMIYGGLPPKNKNSIWQDPAWHGGTGRDLAWHGGPEQGKESFDPITDGELLSLSNETKRTTPTAIEKEDENEDIELQDYRRSTPYHA